MTTENPLKANDSLAVRIARRRLLPVASAATLLSLTGCAQMGGMFHHPAAQDGDINPVTVQSQTANKVHDYTNGLDAALDKVDQDRLRAAADRKNQVVLANAQPAVEPAPAAPAIVAPAPVTPSPVATSNTPAAMGAMTAMVMPSKENTAPLAAVQSGPTDVSVDDALATLRHRVADHPTFNTTLAMALLDNAQGKTPDPAMATALSTADQKMLADLLSALQTMNAASPSATLTDRAAPLLEATKHWQTDADLTLPKLALASRVDSFGVYTPVEPKFQQGEKHTVIIYCEVANFDAKKTADGWYETHLAQQETLVTDDGLLVWRPNPEEVQDRSLNQRHDFYLVKKLTIPDNLAIGKYTLRMSVTDRNSNKIALISIPVEIADK